MHMVLTGWFHTWESLWRQSVAFRLVNYCLLTWLTVLYQWRRSSSGENLCDWTGHSGHNQSVQSSHTNSVLCLYSLSKFLRSADSAATFKVALAILPNHSSWYRPDTSSCRWWLIDWLDCEWCGSFCCVSCCDWWVMTVYSYQAELQSSVWWSLLWHAGQPVLSPGVCWWMWWTHKEWLLGLSAWSLVHGCWYWNWKKFVSFLAWVAKAGSVCPSFRLRLLHSLSHTKRFKIVKHFIYMTEWCF